MYDDIVSENKYYEVKKISIKKVTIIFLIGFIISLGLIVTGFIKKHSVEKKNAIAYQEAYDDSEEKASLAKKRLDEINTEIDSLTNQINDKSNECNSISVEENKNCLNELKTLKKNLSNLESERSNLENDNYTVYYKIISPAKYKIFFYVGIGFIIATAILSILIYDVIKDYEINKLNNKNYILDVQEKINNFATEFAQEIKEEVKPVEEPKEDNDIEEEL